MTVLTKIAFHMKEEDGTEWIREFDGLLGSPEVYWSHEFLNETGQEQITLTMKRKTQQSIDYANYINSKGWLRQP